MRIKNLIPNIITSMNLLCGVVGVILSLDGHLEGGFCLMLAAAVCDFFDGFAARLLNATSPVGKELDSLSDVVSFGVLPAIMLYMVSGDGVRFMKFFPLLLAAFSAYRLAKFNLDERQHDSFIGLPTPASAMICGSLACYVQSVPHSFLAGWTSSPFFIPLLTIVFCFLLVFEIPMFSMKFGGGKKSSRADSVKRIIFIALVAASLVLIIVTRSHWSMAVLLSFTAYVLVNLLLSRLKDDS